MKTVFTFMTLLLCTLLSAQPQQTTYSVEKDICYTSSDDPYSLERCTLDVYHPDNLNDCPVVVWFHGGGLTGGHDHNAMRDPAFHILHTHVRKILSGKN